jgi:hypothetical protein
MVWAGISIDGKTDLHVIAGNLSDVRYRDEILHPISDAVANSHGLLPTASALIGVSRTIWDELLVGRHGDYLYGVCF